MKSFFIGDEDKFPINYSKSKRVDKLIEINKKEINVTYFNDKKFLEETYNKENYPEIFNNIIDNIDNTDYPINLFADLKGKDTLKEIIIDKDNFLFCYAPYKKVNNITFESFETLTFHSLKGKTISKTGIPKNIKNNIEVIDKTTAKIFKAQKNNKESINKHTKNGIVDFPGY